MANDTYIRLVQALERDLDAQALAVDLYERYYLGVHDMSYVTAKWQRAFGQMVRRLVDNWCQIIVDSSAERLSVEGALFPSVTGQGGKPGPDPFAWDIWQSSGMDAAQALAHTTAIYAGRVNVLTAPPEVRGGPPRITVEHPAQTYVRMDTAIQGRRFAAIKRWQETRDDGEPGDTFVTLYLPNATYRLRRRSPSSVVGYEATLTPRSGDATDEVANPLGRVPMVPLENRPLLPGAGDSIGVWRGQLPAGGQSDLVTVIPLQDAITKIMADMLVASEFMSFPQRWATGIDVPTDPETGEELDRETWAGAADRLFVSRSTDTTFGAFPAHDGAGSVTQVDSIIRQIAAQTRTPPHYLLGQITNASGDALKAAETGLVSKVREKQKSFGEGWEEVLRLACGQSGDRERLNDLRAQVAWKDPEVRSVGEAVDAGIKLYQTQLLPLEMVLERLGYSPEDIARAVRLRGLPDRSVPPSAPVPIGSTPPEAVPPPAAL